MPKLAPAIAAGGGLLGLAVSEDADAGLIHRQAADAARRFTKRTPGDGRAPNIGNLGKSQLPQLRKRLENARSVEDQSRAIMQFIHGGTDYGSKDTPAKYSWSKRATRADGGANGPVYLNGMDILYEEMVDLLGKKYEPAVRDYVSRRMGTDFKGRDASYGGEAGAHIGKMRNLRGAGVMDYDQYLRNYRKIDPKADTTFVDPKTGRKKASKASLSVGAPSLGDDHLLATMHNREQKLNEHMDNLGMTADPMYEYGSLLPIKQNIVTGESSLGVPSFVRDMMKGLLGLGMTPETGVYDPNNLLDTVL